MRKGSRSGQEGFTLLEMMIAMTLLAVIVLIVGGTIRMGFRNIEAGQRKIDALERFRTSLGIVESQLQSAFLVKQSGTKLDTDFTQFKGDRNSLQFRSVYSLLGGVRGPVMVTYVVREEQTGGKALYGAETSLASSVAAREIRLFDRAADIFFEYFEKGPTDEKGKWNYEWTSKDIIPDKVRLTIDREGRLFSMIIPIRAGIQDRQLTTVAGPKR